MKYAIGDLVYFLFKRQDCGEKTTGTIATFGTVIDAREPDVFNANAVYTVYHPASNTTHEYAEWHMISCCCLGHQYSDINEWSSYGQQITNGK